MRRAALALVVTLGALCGACSSQPSEAEQLCSRLDAGTVPVAAVAAMPGADQDPRGTATRARDAIRSTCPQHEQAAAGLDAVLDPALSPVPPSATRRTDADEPEPTTTRRQSSSDDEQQRQSGSAGRVGDPGDDGFVEQCVAAGRGRQECVEANQQGGG